MIVQETNISEIRPYENNPRKNDDAVEYVANSIREFGFKQPIVCDMDGTIIAGHTRYKAAKRLGIETVPVVYANDLTPEQVNAYRLADNKVAEAATWDMDKLYEELDGLLDLDMEQFGFDIQSYLDDDEIPDVEHKSLNERFIVPPFSILDTRQGYWQNRKREWKELFESEKGRDKYLISDSKTSDYAYSRHIGLETFAPSTSVFDPVLCEIAYAWFCPKNGNVIDPFAGGSVRGIVAAMTGHGYTGIDLMEEQVDENRRQAERIGVHPNWICDDSTNILNHVEHGSFDMIFSCPPYADLEVYSDDPRDISNMDYDHFIQSYNRIILNTCECLKDDRFAAFVVGDVRDKNGAYRRFVSDTQQAFEDAGLVLYNDMVLVESIGTGAIRAPRTFNASRKVVKTHQNLLVFFKGNIKNIHDAFGDVCIEYDDSDVLANQSS